MYESARAKERVCEAEYVGESVSHEKESVCERESETEREREREREREKSRESTDVLSVRGVAIGVLLELKI